MNIKTMAVALLLVAGIMNACSGDKSRENENTEKSNTENQNTGNVNRENENRDNYNHSTDSAGTPPEYNRADSARSK